MRYAVTTTLVRLRRSIEPDPRTPGGTRPGPWETADREAISGCFVGPAMSSAETDPLRQSVTNEMTVYGPWELDVRPGDRLEDPAGGLWDVETDPQRYQSPFSGWPAGAVAGVTRTKG